MLKQGYIHIKGCYPEAWVKHLETLIKDGLGNEALKLAMEDNATVLVAKSLCGLEPLQHDVRPRQGLRIRLRQSALPDPVKGHVLMTPTPSPEER